MKKFCDLGFKLPKAIEGYISLLLCFWVHFVLSNLFSIFSVVKYVYILFQNQNWKERDSSYSYLPQQINQQKAQWKTINDRVDEYGLAPGKLSPVFTRSHGRYPLAADFYMRKLKKRGYGDDPRKMIPYPRLG